MNSGPPYSPPNAGVGGLPTIGIDVPITSVFLFLFLLGAITNMTILQLNRRRGHKFLASGALFGFCMARIVTCTMRLVWATHPTSVQIAIAANVFVNAGVIIIIIINLIFAQRILRASRPKVGWHRATHWLFLAYYGSIILMLAALITSIVQQSYTLDGNIRRIDRDIQLVGATYNTVAAFLPIPLLIIGVVLPKLSSAPRHVDKFGQGRFRTKIRIVLFGCLLITLGAAFRAGIAYVPRPVNDPAWYHSKACFYCFNFLLEIIVIFTYGAVRVDKRFHIPNGASGPGQYSSEKGTERRVVSEEEFLDDFRPDGSDSAATEWEKRAEAELESGIREPPMARVA
jgi:hypothetical protein